MINRKILYVEDNDITKELVYNYLNKHYSVIYLASNGKEGLEIFKDKPVDIVIADIKMPEMDGLTMSFEIKKIKKNIPIIITTSYDDKNYLLKCIDIGINKFISKPIDLQLLNNTIDGLLNEN